jgi:hypothetical protein
MSTLKTLTTSLTAAVLVTGISFAWAQSEDRSQQTDTTTAAGAMPSEQTPADPNALPAANSTTGNQALQQSPNDPSRTMPPAGTTSSPMPGQMPAMQGNSVSPTTSDTASSGYETAPRADRN